MEIFKINLQNIKSLSCSEFISFIKETAFWAGFTIERRIDNNQALFYMGNVISLKSEMINKFSSLPYLKVVYDIEKKSTSLSLCYNSFTILGLVFFIVLISITLLAGIIYLKIKNIIIPLALLLITIHSFYIRLIPFIKFKNKVLSRYNSKI